MQKLIIFLGLLALAYTSPIDEKKRCPSQTSVSAAKHTKNALFDLSIGLLKNFSATSHDKNFIVSPVSIALGLALLESGASGETREQLHKVLIEDGSNAAVAPVYASLQRLLQVNDQKTLLTIANGFYPQAGFQIKDDYTTQVDHCFEAKAEPINFRQDTEAARQKINKFVSEKTHDKIPELLKQGSVTGDTVALLVNALYLKTAWKVAFDTAQTKDQIFYAYGNDDKTQKSPFLHLNDGSRKHLATDKLDLVELPYEDDLLAMYIVAPKRRDGVKEVEGELTGKEFRALLERMTVKPLSLALPKFSVRTSLDLKSILSKIGVSSIFAENADFSRMTDAAVKVSKAVHEAYLKIDENGTEGAAATGFEILPRSGRDTPVEVVVDRPFLYTIVHKETGAVVFTGKINYIEN